MMKQKFTRSIASSSSSSSTKGFYYSRRKSRSVEDATTEICTPVDAAAAASTPSRHSEITRVALVHVLWK